MPPTRTRDESDGRLTLPSIHTLNLPLLFRPATMASSTLAPNASHENYDHSKFTRIAPQHSRRLSTSSSATSASRESSPAPQHARNFSTSSSATTTSRYISPTPTSPEDNPNNPFASGKPVRLRACSVAEADAIFIVGPRVTASPSGKSNHSPTQFKEPSMLIFGSNVEDFRNNPRNLPRGTRVHPYRIVRSPSPSSGRRRSIVINPIPPPRRWP